MRTTSASVGPHDARSGVEAMRHTSGRGRVAAAVPTWDMVAAKLLELRRRRGLMIAVVLLILGPPVLVLGFRLLFHAIDPSRYGPAGDPSIFSGIVNPMAELGFIMAATLGTAAGTTDLTDGVFRHLVVTGRSRLALFLARIPAGLGILLPLVATGFLMLCLVTTFEAPSPPASVDVNGVVVPLHLDRAQLQQWVEQHPQAAASAFESGPPGVGPATPSSLHQEVGVLYGEYTANELTVVGPPINEMVKIGLWLELVVAVGFIAGLGLGSLTGQRTVATIVMIALEIIITPILAAHAIPYFINGQRLVVGLALDQLRPAALGSGGAGPAHGLLGGRGALGIDPMPTWAMVTVIAGWIVGWTGIGAWKMATRDA